MWLFTPRCIYNGYDNLCPCVHSQPCYLHPVVILWYLHLNWSISNLVCIHLHYFAYYMVNMPLFGEVIRSLIYMFQNLRVPKTSAQYCIVYPGCQSIKVRWTDRRRDVKVKFSFILFRIVVVVPYQVDLVLYLPPGAVLLLLGHGKISIF